MNETTSSAGRGVGQKFLTFFLEEEEYGIEILSVREIVGLLPVTPVPQTPAYVEGVVNLRGQVIPVVDLRLRFDMPGIEATDETCIIVVHSGGAQLGVIVDKVSEVRDIVAQDIVDAPTLGNEINTEYVSGIGKAGNRVHRPARHRQGLPGDRPPGRRGLTAPANHEAREANVSTEAARKEHDAFDRVSQLMYRISGVNLTEKKRELVRARIAKRMRALGHTSVERYVEHVESDQGGEELGHMIDALTTNKTSFFRELPHFEFLRRSVLPRWASEGGPLRIWSAGCSSGQEPYSVAMLIHEIVRDAAHRDVRILGDRPQPRGPGGGRGGRVRDAAGGGDPRGGARPVPGAREGRGGAGLALEGGSAHPRAWSPSRG